jgi:hypothetical protein
MAAGSCFHFFGDLFCEARDSFGFKVVLVKGKFRSKRVPLNARALGARSRERFWVLDRERSSACFSFSLAGRFGQEHTQRRCCIFAAVLLGAFYCIKMKCFLLDSIILFAAVLPMAATAAGFPKNESSYLNFHIPHSLRRNESYPHRSAMFGEHYTQWGDAGSITLPVKVASGDLALCMPPSPDKMKEWHLPEDSAYILVAHRGSCTFVRKARVAQQIGAAALLIADPQSDKLPRTMANDGCMSF